MSAKHPIAILCTIAALGLTTAHAAPRADEVSVNVRVDDLRLDTQAGATAALQRIEGAAREICGGENDARDLGRWQLQRACITSTVDRAVAQAHVPELTALRSRPIGAMASAR
jgi:UrcA family protein